MTTNTALNPFSFESHQIRVVADEQGEPWFVAKDVCDILGYKNSSLTISRHCREGGISKRYTPTESGEQEMIFINEGNLYRLIVKSNMPIAEKFESWVCDEVLPSIRKTGSYTATITPAQQLQLRRAVAKIAHKPEHFKSAYHHLHDQFQISEYKQLPSSQLEEALAFIASLEGEYLPRHEIPNALHELPKPTPAEQIFAEHIAKVRTAFYAWRDTVKAKHPDIGWPDIDVNDLALALIKDQIGMPRFLVSFTDKGELHMSLIPGRTVIATPEELLMKLTAVRR